MALDQDKQIRDLNEQTTINAADELLLQDGVTAETKRLGADTLRDWTTGTAWQSWTPTWTNVTVGNGSVSAKYIRIGNTVHARLILILGTTSAITGTPNFTLPVTATGYSSSNFTIGQAYYVDAGVASYTGTLALLASNTIANPLVNGVAATYAVPTLIGTAVPFSWGTADVMTFTFTYEAA
jgi:hypothetical protein